MNRFAPRPAEKNFQGAADRLGLVTDQGTRLHALVANERAMQEAFHEGDRVHGGLHLDDPVMVQTG